MVPAFKNVWERSIAKNYRSCSLLSVVSNVLEKLVYNRLDDRPRKFVPFSDFQGGFRSFPSTADFLTVVSDGIARVFNRSGATQSVTLDLYNAFDRVSDQVFGHTLPFLSNKRFQVALDGKSS